MIDSVVASLVVYLVIWPLVYALWPKPVELTLEAYLHYVRLVGRGVRRLITGLFQ